MEDQNNITSLAAYRRKQQKPLPAEKNTGKKDTPQRWYVRPDPKRPEYFEEVQIIQKPVQGIVRRKSDGQLLHICCRALVSGETKEIIQGTQSLFRDYAVNQLASDEEK